MHEARVLQSRRAKLTSLAFKYYISAMFFCDDIISFAALLPTPKYQLTINLYRPKKVFADLRKLTDIFHTGTPRESITPTLIDIKKQAK